MDKAMFGSWLKERRKTLDLTQDDLAEQIGCSVATIRKIESNKLRPSKQIAERLAKQLGVHADDLAAFIRFARSGEPPPRVASLDLDDADDIATIVQPTLDTHSTHLPTWPTPLLGRARDLAEVQARLMRADLRLLTITGAPGIGKTRVAVQAATELLTAFDDGVCFVALAQIREPHLVLAAIAQALGVHALTSQSLKDNLKAYLSHKHMLLLLDNFEHVLAAVPIVAELVAVAPRLKVLVTSRARLQLYGEHELPIAPLALPDLTDLPSVDCLLTEYASIALFTARVQAVRPAFVLTSANAATVAEICVRLDGLPLAIELAAARSKLFMPQALLSRLTRRLDVLIGGPRDMPARQQTLRSTIDWSYHLLDAGEQALFRRLGVFVGGCTIEAAAAVVGGPATDSLEVGGSYLPALPAQSLMAEQLAALVDKSLLRQEDDENGEPRFVLLEMLREYALERLALHEETDTIQQRHARYYLALAEEAAPRLYQADQARWLDRLERDHDNLRMALAWCRERTHVELGLRLAGNLTEFWAVRGHFSEGRAWLEQFLADTDGLTPMQARAHYGAGLLAYGQSDYAIAHMRYIASLDLYRDLDDNSGAASALAGLGRVAFSQHDYVTARQHFEASLALCRACEDRLGIAHALNYLGVLARNSGEFAAGRMLTEESLALYRELGHPGGIAAALYFLGIVAYHQGDRALERACYLEGLAIRRALSDRWGIAYTLLNLGLASIHEGDYTGAHIWLQESLELYQKLGDKNGVAMAYNNLGDLARVQDSLELATTYYTESLTLYQAVGKKTPGLLFNLGYVAYQQNDPTRAMALFRESLQEYQAWEDHGGIGLCLVGAASVADSQRQPERAARVLGAAERLFGTSSTNLDGVDRINYERSVGAIRAQLNSVAFATAWAEGRRLSLVGAIAEAFPEAAVYENSF
jgi:predicted ATPase/transcriptional regulator with XRE-family HTH domain